MFYQNRSTPEVVSKGATGKKGGAGTKAGKVVKRRAATADEEKKIRNGQWVRVDKKGKKGGESGYAKSKIRPQLTSALEADDVNTLTDTELAAAWFSELAALGREPDVSLIASLEIEAHARGWDPFDLVVTWEPDEEHYEAARIDRLVASIPGLVAAWDPDRHPRGRDGKFIEVFGIIKIFGHMFKDKKGREISLDGRRAKVMSIKPDKKNPGKPTIRVGVFDKNDRPSLQVDLKPNDIEMAPEKARIKSRLPDANAPEKPGGPNLSQRQDDGTPLNKAKADIYGDAVPVPLDPPPGRPGKGARERFRGRLETELRDVTGNDDLRLGARPVYGRDGIYDVYEGDGDKRVGVVDAAGKFYRPNRVDTFGAPSHQEVIEDRVIRALYRLPDDPTDEELDDAIGAMRSVSFGAAGRYIDKVDGVIRDLEDMKGRVASIPSLVAAWNPDLHPRGRDGKFIEVFGIVKLFDFKFKTKSGKDIDLNGRRGKVMSIKPNKKTPGKPDIRIGVFDKNDKPSLSVDVKPTTSRWRPRRRASTAPARRERPRRSEQADAPNKPDSRPIPTGTASPPS